MLALRGYLDSQQTRSKGLHKNFQFLKNTYIHTYVLTACPRHGPSHISRNGPSFSPSSVSQNVPQPLSVRHACNCHIVHTSTHIYWPFGCIHNPTATCCCCACLVFFVFVVFFVALFNQLHILVHEHFSSHFCGVSVAHSFHRCQLLSVISNCCWR